MRDNTSNNTLLIDKGKDTKKAIQILTFGRAEHER